MAALAEALGVHIPVPRCSVPTEVLRIVPALRHTHTNLHENPQWVDLERLTGLSARQLRRAFRRHPEWLGTAGFRSELKWRRIQLAHSLLDSDASGVEVARALGYGSDRALYTALRRAGLRRGG